MLAEGKGARLAVLGSGTAVQTGGEGYAGIYARLNGRHMLFDAGPGTLSRLNRLGVNLFDIERVYLTHLHPDHCLDMAALLFGLRIPVGDRPHKTLRIFGPKGLARLVKDLDAAFQGWLSPKHYTLEVREIEEGSLRHGGYTLRARAMTHSAPAFGYRVACGGKTFAYSGDTDFCYAIIELSRAVDVLILECSMPDERKAEGHLTPSECGRIAAAAGVKHLVLTHFYPVFERYPLRRKVRAHYKGKLTLARGLTVVAL